MKIYVASSWRTPTHPEVVMALRDAGHLVYDYRAKSFNWTDIGLDNFDASHAELMTVFEREDVLSKFNQDDVALEWAEALVLVLPAGRSAHTEFGYMCGQNKYTVIIWSPSEPELLHLMADKIVPDVAGAIQYLAEL